MVGRHLNLVLGVVRMVNYGVVGDVRQWTIPPGEPAPAQLVTGSAQRSLGNSNLGRVKAADKTPVIAAHAARGTLTGKPTTVTAVPRLEAERTLDKPPIEIAE
ncbi:hypothetical protein ACROYT_G005014 [Oculina patagonica]